MNDPFGNISAFAPEPSDSIRELRWKAESMLEYLVEHEAVLRKFPTSLFEERLALWRPLTQLLAAAMEDAELADDARLEANRVWAEEMHRSALFVVTMYVHAQSESARKRFADDPEALEELLERLEKQRPRALMLLTSEERTLLRQRGFLRPGE